MAFISFGTGATANSGTVSEAVDFGTLNTADGPGTSGVDGFSTTPYSGFTFSDTSATTMIRFVVSVANANPNVRITFASTAATGVRTSGTSTNGTGVTDISAGAFNSNVNNVFWGTAAQLQTFIQSITVTTFEGAGTATTTVTLRFTAFNGTSNATKAGLGAQVAGTGQVSASPATAITPCYTRGTRIAVPGGEAAVETLAIGDLVTTVGGRARKVKWIGRGFHTAQAVAATPSLRPVLIRAGALAEGVPVRDLIVSPMHGMAIDEVIVPAAALVNGGSIVRMGTDAGVDYFHVELDGHALILAEGAPAETFIDDNSRSMFDNAAEYAALYAPAPRAAEIAPRVEEGYLLEAIHRRLAGRTGLADTARGTLRGLVERLEDGVLQGWAADEAGSVELEVLVEGEIVSRVLANRFRTDLDDAGIHGGRAGFTLALPASVDDLAQVEVRRASDGAVLQAMVEAPAHA